MTLEIRNGKSIILHDDNTWEFDNNNKYEEIEEDFTVTLDDNRIIMIRTDYSWGFIEKAALDHKANLPVTLITASGSALHVVLSQASAIAMQNAVLQATKKLQHSLKNRKMNFKMLQDCVRRVEKDIDSQETFTKDKGWRVVTQITLDGGSILAVIACASEEDVASEK